MSSNMYDERWMRVALTIGKRLIGNTWPNPSVGCVIVKDGSVVGRGWTGDGGRPHAETIAINQAGSAAKGGTAYVSLEPCDHVGQTQPCTKKIIEAGISRVVIAVVDPDPRVSGNGIKTLKAAGIEVKTGVLKSEARRDHRGFFSRIEKGLPYITLKLAMSFDGKIATKSGQSKWITNSAARRLVHLMRSQHDAILVGRGTVCADDPNLAPRDVGAIRPSVRIVMDSRLNSPINSQIAQSATQREPVWICHGSDASENKIREWNNLNAKTILCKTINGKIKLRDALSKLADRGLTLILCEGGSQLAGSLIHNDLVDEVVGFSSGVMLGKDGLSPIDQQGVDDINEAPRFTLQSSKDLGGNVMHNWVRTEF